MLRRIVIPIFLFETTFITITGFNKNIFNDHNLLLFNILFVLWLVMESIRVRLGHDNNAQTFGKFSRSFLIISFASIFIAAWERAMAYPIAAYSLPTYSIYVEVILFFIGVYLRHLSIKHLGKYFVTKVQVTYSVTILSIFSFIYYWMYQVHTYETIATKTTLKSV